MILEKIISLTNKKDELRFLAMVRSLRDTGCILPVWVIPYDDNIFKLPENCFWWELEEVTTLLREQNAHNMKKKYQCLLTTNYQYVDSDIIFLKNPENELKELNGFIASCCHWNNPEYTYSRTSVELFKNKSTTWQKSVFNAGQFACDKQLFTLDELKTTLLDPNYKECLLDFNYHDQLALNLLVFLSCIKVTNITLPPYNVESTWAGDYLDDEYNRYWLDIAKKPYLIHWAGCNMRLSRPIDKLITNYLNTNELKKWQESISPVIHNNTSLTFRKAFYFVKQCLGL